MTTAFESSTRIKTLPPYLFAELDRRKAEVQARGVKVISLGIGDPDLPTPELVRQAMHEAIEDTSTHQYPAYNGSLPFREAVARFYKRRYDVTLDPQTEVLALIGSKEGIAHLPLALLNPGDLALTPNPGYPVYSVAAAFAGAKVEQFTLQEEHQFFPDFGSISVEVLDQAKLMFLNYPNNPTSAVASTAQFSKAVEMARTHQIALLHDAAYSELGFDGYQPGSILQARGAKEVAIETGSLSKTFNMTGWRIGYAVGNRDLVGMLGKIKTNMDSGVFTAIQKAGIAALDAHAMPNENCAIYQARRNMLMPALEGLGYRIFPSRSTFFLWIHCKPGMSSMDTCNAFLDRVGVVVTPGSGFGTAGEGYFRISLTVNETLLEEVVDRLKKL